MKESNFQFKDPYILELNFKENENFVVEKFESLKSNFNVSINRSETELEAFITLEVNLGDNDRCPFQLSVKIGANFFWSEDFDEELVDICLNKNAPALLISYIRPIIANVTSFSRFPSFNLPFIDLYSEDN